MKKSLVTVVLMFAMVAFAVAQAPAADPQQGAAGAQAGQAADPAQTGAAPQKKEIKDQAEYSAYISAIQQQDPNAKASALEGFIQQYPNSVVKVDAMEALMGAYQQLGNAGKLTDTAQRIVQVQANHVPSLAVLSAVRRGEGLAQTNQQQATALLVQARDFATRGVQALQSWPKPEGVDQAAFDKQKRDLGGLFQGTIGLANASENNFQGAVEPLRAAVEANPMDFHTVYWLGRSLLELKPAQNQNQIAGIFFVTRAAALLQGASQQQMLKYARSRYSIFHGGEDGFEQVMQAASQNPLPPQGFSIQPGPTPAEQAAKMAAKPANQLSFDEFEFIFQNATPADAEKVWNAIKGKPIAFQAKVVEATPETLRVAATYENAQKNVADVTITMTDAIPAKMMPRVGADATVTGTPVSYTAEPFMITMDNGKMAVIKGTAPATPTKAPAKKGTATKRPAPKKR